MSKEIVAFEKEAKELMVKISKAHVAKKKIEEQDKKVREQLLELCKKHKVKSIENEYVKISWVEGSETKTIDLKRVKEQEPEAYDALLENYPKISSRKGYVRITPKVGK